LVGRRRAELMNARITPWALFFSRFLTTVLIFQMYALPARADRLMAASRALQWPTDNELAPVSAWEAATTTQPVNVAGVVMYKMFQ
jgi:hypothetical protein